MCAKRSGVIVNLSSGGASKAHRGNAAYDAAKGGIEAFTRALALDLGPYGVRVCTLVPGSIDTQGLPEEERIKRGVNVPLARVGTPEDLAGPAVFLASDDARYVTGSIVFSDGGMLAQQRSATSTSSPSTDSPACEARRRRHRRHLHRPDPRRRRDRRVHRREVADDAGRPVARRRDRAASTPPSATASRRPRSTR